MTPAQVYIGLGSNLGDKRHHIQQALLALQAISEQPLRCSSLYLSQPWGYTDQPEYVNAVCRLATRLTPMELLAGLQRIENEHDRVRERKWGPRTLDLDILLFADMIIKDDVLKVPHPHMLQRAFVLIPLLEIDPDLTIPGAGRALAHVRSHWHAQLTIIAS